MTSCKLDKSRSGYVPGMCNNFEVLQCDNHIINYISYIASVTMLLMLIVPAATCTIGNYISFMLLCITLMPEFFVLNI